MSHPPRIFHSLVKVPMTMAIKENISGGSEDYAAI